jgi:hypothetical protein
MAHENVFRSIHDLCVSNGAEGRRGGTPRLPSMRCRSTYELISIVCISRHGSGKDVAFLIPFEEMIQKPLFVNADTDSETTALARPTWMGRFDSWFENIIQNAAQ